MCTYRQLKKRKYFNRECHSIEINELAAQLRHRISIVSGNTLFGVTKDTKLCIKITSKKHPGKHLFYA